MSLENAYKNIVERYIREFRPFAYKEDRYYQRLRTLDEAISQAAMCLEPRGKRHPHQYRIPKKSLETAKSILLKTNLASCSNFEQLHEQVNRAISHVHMIGPLTVYDISQRIGAYLKLQPNLVFLHRGTAIGAKAMGLTSNTDRIRVSELPQPFHKLTADEVEDCLCIYKYELAAAHAN